MDRNTVIAILSIFLIFMLYMQFFGPKTKPGATQPARTEQSATNYVEQPEQAAHPKIVSGSNAVYDTSSYKAQPEFSGYSSGLVEITNPLIRYTFSPAGGDIYRITLERTDVVRKGPVVTTVAPSNEWQVPLRLQEVGELDVNALQMGVEKSDASSIVFTGTLDSTFAVRKTYRLEPDNYLLQASIVLSNISPGSVNLSNRFKVWAGRIDEVSLTRDRYSIRGVDAHYQKEDGRYGIQRIQENKDNNPKIIEGSIEWYDVRNKYFTHIIIPEQNAEALSVLSFGPKGDRNITTIASYGAGNVGVGETFSWNATLYAGPKEYERLKTLPERVGKGTQYNDILKFTFAFLAKPILIYGLKGLYKYVHNYGVAIIILTIIIKLLTWPLTSKSVTSMKQMEKIQPELATLKEKYKDNPQKLNQEMMLLYRKHGYNPLGGCLPMLLQFPIFIALYSALSNAIELHGASFLWIKDLSMPDSVYTLPYIPFFGDKALGVTGVHPLAIMMGLAMFGQQMLSPKTGDATQRRMMYIMPAVFIVIFYNMPSGLVLYWFMNQVLTMGQMFYLHYIKKS